MKDMKDVMNKANEKMTGKADNKTIGKIAKNKLSN